MTYRQAGFSLLELLVALFVVVLVTSLVSLNVGSGGRDIELEAQVRELANIAAYALDEAQLLGVDYGLLLEQRDEDGETVFGWRWLERRPEGWREPSSGKEVFAPGQLPAEVELQLELEDVPLDTLALAPTGEEQTPQLVFFASGETAPGAIDLRRRDNGELLWRIEWDLLGRFDLLRRGEPEDLR